LSAYAVAISAPETTTLPPYVVTATRLPQDPATLPFSTEVFTAEALRRSPARTLDDTLRHSAAFSLFRRSGSGTANPTAQGVSLRGLGPSGASRSLVLLDGIPLNDPFGGWVAWSKLPVASLDRVELVRGGGSASWGGSSLGGVIQLLSAPLLPSRRLPLLPPRRPPLLTPRDPARPEQSVTNLVTLSENPSTGRVVATLGEFGTRAVNLVGTIADGSGANAFRLDASAAATDGPRLVLDPGPVDQPADSETQRAQLTWARRINDSVTLTTAARLWREERGNGTPYQRNASREAFASATLAGTPATGLGWSATLYGQDQDFRSTFSAVNATRTAETPASDQYAVPATAAGTALQFTFGDPADLAVGTGSITTLGLDARHVDGESREFFFFNGSAFTRERRSGGAQTVAGLFASHARPLAADLTFTSGLRLDATRRTAGFRRETNRTSGAVLLDQRYPDRDDLALNPSLGLAWRATKQLTARAAAYTAYRTPTLNELYRPFRVGPTTTRANPTLDPETLLGGELGLDWTSTAGRYGLRATVFQNDLDGAIANVTLNPTTRERRNLDSTRVRGLEFGGHWQALPSLRFEADYLLSDARVLSGGPAASALDGRRLAQVPRHTLSTGVSWQATRALALDLRARTTSAQWEDDLNTLNLAHSTRLDLAARYELTTRWQITVAVENLLDAKTQTGRTSTSVINLAPPRRTRVELSYEW